MILADRPASQKSYPNYLAMNGIIPAIKTRENNSNLVLGSPCRIKFVRERKKSDHDVWRVVCPYDYK
jgi:hypothetical protein